MRKQHHPKRRSVLRVEELIARSLPAVLNPCAGIIGDTAIVSTAGDEPAVDATLSADAGEVSTEGSVDTTAETLVDETSYDLPDDSATIRFKPINFSTLPDDGSEVVDGDPASYDLAASDMMAYSFAATDEVPVEEITADGTDATATTDFEGEPKVILPEMTWRGAVSESSSDETNVDDSTDLKPVVCYFGGMNERNLTGSTEGEKEDTTETLEVSPDCDYPIVDTTKFTDIDPAVCYFGGINERNLTGSTDVATDDTTSTTDATVDDGSSAPSIDLTNTTDETEPNIFFHPMNWGGMIDIGASNDNSDVALDSTDKTEVVEDPTVIAYDAGVPVPGDDLSDFNIQTFGGPADDGISFLAYSSVPAPNSAPVVAPANSDVTTTETTATIDASAWSFFATKHEEVTAKPTAQTPAADTNNIGIVPPTTQQSNEAPASSTLDNGPISLDGSSVKKLFLDFSVDQK